MTQTARRIRRQTATGTVPVATPTPIPIPPGIRTVRGTQTPRETQTRQALLGVRILDPPAPIQDRTNPTRTTQRVVSPAAIPTSLVRWTSTTWWDLTNA